MINPMEYIKLALIALAVVLLVVIALVFRLVKSWRARGLVVLSILVGTYFGLWVLLGGPQAGHKAEVANEMLARQKEAQSWFEERCKTAGVKIYRTVEGVDSVYLLKVRPDHLNYSDQYVLDDPYGHDLGDYGYIGIMLWGRGKDGFTQSSSKVGISYRYVYALDPKDGQLSRFELSGQWPQVGDPPLNKTPVNSVPLQYGVTYDDISTREDRDHWVAGSSLRVIDLRTSQVLGERIGYMWDPGMGSTNNRQPWLMAKEHACPAFPMLHPNVPLQVDQTRTFVEKILRPKTGN